VAALRFTAGMLALERELLPDAEREFTESLRIARSGVPCSSRWWEALVSELRS
jgi:hypothetical protein